MRNTDPNSNQLLDWQLTVSFTFAAALETLLGAYLSQFVSARQLQKGFGYFLLAVAGFILFQNRYSFYRSSPTHSNSLLQREYLSIDRRSVKI